MARRAVPRIIKRYGVYTGARFARVEFPDGKIVDVPTRTGDRKAFEETRAAQLKMLAQAMRDGATVRIDENADYTVEFPGGH